MKKVMYVVAIATALAACQNNPQGQQPQVANPPEQQAPINPNEPKLVLANIEGMTPKEYPASESYKVIEGNPMFKVWALDHYEKTDMGVWESSKGKWSFDTKRWEYSYIRKGISIITEEGKAPVTLKPGDSFVLRPGIKGTWEVVEDTQKDYITYYP